VNEAAHERFQRGLLHLLPLGTVLLALSLDLLPITSPAPGSAFPSLTLIVVYYWMLHRPDLLTALDLFCLGLLADLVGGTPPGCTSLVLLALRRFVVAPQRLLFSGSFFAGWAGLVATAAVVAALRWGLAALVYETFFPVGTLIVETALAVTLYPVLAVLLGALSKTLPDEVHAAEG
jgi:rod shape-determining protein MreD